MCADIFDISDIFPDISDIKRFLPGTIVSGGPLIHAHRQTTHTHTQSSGKKSPSQCGHVRVINSIKNQFKINSKLMEIKKEINENQ